MDIISEVISFLLGGLVGSFLTLQIKKQQSGSRGNVVDQSDSRAGGDIVGRDKVSKR